MIWIAGIIVVCFGVCLPFYMHYKASPHLVMACAYKSLGTLCAFLAALVAAIRLEPKCWPCAAAILFFAIADTLLEFNFIFGMGFFLAGHIFNIAFFLKLAPVSSFHLLGFLFLAAITSYTFWHWRKQVGKQFPAFVVYGLVLVFMCVSAISCFLISTLAGILIACGGALFYISDILLFYKLMRPTGEITNWMIMITYYSSLLLFGIACLQL